jgi:tRNA G18 (ribose-2'-O)-methylase SpoU
MPIERLETVDDERLADYRHVPDPELLRRGEIFVAEGRLVVRALLTQSRFRARSILLTEAAYDGLADVLAPRLAGTPVFVVPASAIERLTGFNIHRGCLAIGERPGRLTVREMLARLPRARRLVVLERIGNADNMGGIFRNAAAFGADAVVVGPGCCDPLYRKAIRVSVGAALRVPFCHADDWMTDLQLLNAAGFTLAALTPAGATQDLDAWVSSVAPEAKVAVLAGSEGDGLTAETLAQADVALRIPMAPSTESLNVSTAVGIALHRLFVFAPEPRLRPSSSATMGLRRRSRATAGKPEP